MTARFALPLSLSCDPHSTQPSNATLRHLSAATFWCQGLFSFCQWAWQWCAEYTITFIIWSCLSRNYLNICSPWLTHPFYLPVSSTCLATAADFFLWCQQVWRRITSVTLLIALHSLFLIIIFILSGKAQYWMKRWAESFNFGAFSKTHTWTKKNPLETHSKYIVKVLIFIRHQ